MKNSPLQRWSVLFPLSAAALAALLLLSRPAPAQAAGGGATATETAPMSSADQKAVAAAYDTWLKTVSSAHGDPAPVLKLYAPDAILVATYSPVLLHNDNGELAGYFKKFTALPNLAATTSDLQTRVYGDFAINTGLYTFTFNSLEGDKVSVPARFTFVYRRVGDQWEIVDHHSSLVPEAL